jgi:hypothetical protein
MNVIKPSVQTSQILAWQFAHDTNNFGEGTVPDSSAKRRCASCCIDSAEHETQFATKLEDISDVFSCGSQHNYFNQFLNVFVTRCERIIVALTGVDDSLYYSTKEKGLI